jgi:Fe/S biogenesis protein NfuA
MADQAEATSNPRITFTESAAHKLREVIGGYPQPVAGLRLQIVGRGPEGFDHVLSIVAQGHEPEGDAVAEAAGLRVFVEGENAPYLNGVTIDFHDKGPNISGLEFNNPNPLWLEPVAARIQALFDQQINPAIAAHGGYVSLLSVHDDVAYVQLGGGCQGCGMADVTLKQGIETAVLQAVPEIKHVVDSTDHAAGSNPYFKPSKK